jgi:hypothetical protein
MSPEPIRGSPASGFWSLCCEGLLGHDHRQVGSRRLLVGPNRTGYLVPDRLQALEIGGKCPGIAIRQLAVGVIRHDRHKLTPVGSDAGSHRRDDVGLSPVAEPCLGIRGQVGRVEDAEARNLETDLRSSQRTLQIGFAEEGAGSVTAGAIHDGDQVLAALYLALGEGRRN